MSLAGRFTDYSTSGEVPTWKAGVSWNINDALRLRGTRSRDIRAPNLPELYTSTSLNFDTVLDPLTNGQYLQLPARRAARQPERRNDASGSEPFPYPHGNFFMMNWHTAGRIA